MRFLTLTVALTLLQCSSATQKAPMTKTAATDTITITGVVTNEGVECPAVRGDNGKLYTIVGKDREKLAPGVRVKITGTVAEVSTCMQGITISATSIERITAATHQSR